VRRAGLLLPVLVLAASAEGIVRAPIPRQAASEGTGLKTAVFSGGCFWGVEGVFSHVKGVRSAVSGYRGGKVGSPDYEAVSTGITGHAESVRVTYDPAVIRYDQLLQVFFSVATDPTELNRQGPDVGTQYRSALVPQSEEQRRVAAAYLAQLGASGLWKQPVVTKIEANGRFFPAESYHQDFMARNPDHPYIRRWDAPKVEGLARLYPALYKPDFTRN